MNIVLLGANGYIGWTLLMHYAKLGHKVIGVDSKLKQIMMNKEGITALDIEQDFFDKVQAVNRFYKSDVQIIENDICSDGILRQIITETVPDVIIHLAEQPSAPFSMKDEHSAVGTISNNYVGTLRLIHAVKDINPDIHIIKLGTMGEYGTPNIDIEEGWINIEHNGRSDKMLYPKKPHSIYHLSKVNDSDALAFACRVWGLRVTDLNQGFVYGVHTDETRETNLYPRFCYDGIFGTVLNRFAVQGAIGHPLTIYGTGGQKRPMININDVIQCIDIVLEDAPDVGEFKVFNQFTEFMSINKMAELVELVTLCPIQNIDNPRTESEDHYYNPSNESLVNLGLVPRLLNSYVITELVEWIQTKTVNINKELITPNVRWNK